MQNPRGDGNNPNYSGSGSPPNHAGSGGGGGGGSPYNHGGGNGSPNNRGSPQNYGGGGSPHYQRGGGGGGGGRQPPQYFSGGGGGGGGGSAGGHYGFAVYGGGASHGAGQGSYRSGGGGGGGGYSARDDDEYWKRLDAEREARKRLMLEEHEAILREQDPAKRLELQRARYKCGHKFVEPQTLHRYSDIVRRLKELPNNTTCATAGHGFEDRGGWTMPNDTITITESDTLRRKPVDERLNSKLCLYRGDITALEVDAIVNAANESLMGGGGIDGAIHSAAGPLLLDECRPLHGCETGDTKITAGYALPAKHILHTVGPMGRGDRQLRGCYRTCLELVEKHKLRTVAFCCVGTGIFGFPLVRATHIALSETRKWLEELAKRPTTPRTR
jgi:O-acetyl-ADP-ribose deacetylase (regulator of RNase III)